MRHKSTELMGTIKAFVEEYYKNYRHSPSTTEIANAVGIARGTAYKYLLAMSDNGMIRYDGQQISTEQTEKVQTEFTSVHYLVLFPAACLRWRKSTQKNMCHCLFLCLATELFSYLELTASP